MRKALRTKNPRGNVSSVYPFNAPLKGWFTSDNLAAMPKDSAFVLDNWFPETDAIAVRPGFEEWATMSVGAVPVEEPVRTLMVHSAGGVHTLFAAVDEYIFDVTATGDSGTPDVSSLNSDDFIWTNFATSGGNFLYTVNQSGSDNPQVYDGTSWSEPAITGATEATFNYVFSYKSRLFFLEINGSTAHFLPVDSIAGAVGQLAVGAELTLGGVLIAGGTLTHDAGDGPDDYCVFVSSEGEVVIYAGTDPGSASEWAKIGTYRIGRPIGNRCLLKIGGDIAVLCSDGVTSLTRSILLDRAAQQNAAFTNNISDAFSAQFTLTGSVAGWQLLSWPIGHMAIVNVPITAESVYYQYVMNVLTGAWARYTGINSLCWALSGEDLYFGTVDGRVMLYGFKAADDGEVITANAIPAWSAMGQVGKLKHVKTAQVFMRASGAFVLGMNIAVDFQPVQFAIVTSSFEDESAMGGIWDVGLWDVALWAGSIPSNEAVKVRWLGIAGNGYYLSPAIFAQTGQTTDLTPVTVKFLSTNLVSEGGAIIG